MHPDTRQSQARPKAKKRFGVLFTCMGRRVELIDAFRRAAKQLGIGLTVHGTDATRLAPAFHKVDKPHILPRIDGCDYGEALVSLVRKAGIDLLIPLIDLELPVVAASAKRLDSLGCCALVSSESVVQTCGDKIATYRALMAADIDTPATWTWREVVKRKRHRFPYFLKPRYGSAAMGSFVVRNRDELHTMGKRVPNAIVQEFVEGEEHTLDVYTGFDGRPRCVVPRKRLEVRSGEVSKGLIVKDPAIMAIGDRVARMLGECRGVITVQCIVTAGERIRVIEVNPRFGGGVPLAIHAGADFPKWILSELIGRRPRINPTGFRDNVAMLRFDDSVFVRDASKLVDGA